MHRWPTLPLAALSLVMLAWPARADDVPDLDVAQLCHGIASQSFDPLAGGEPTVTFETCMQAEHDDREQLKKEWSGFAAADRKNCVTETKMGGELSYTELITCLEWPATSNSCTTRRRRRRRPRRRPGLRPRRRRAKPNNGPQPRA